MRAICRNLVSVLLMLCLLPIQGSIAELSPERATFYRQRTEEWEKGLGPYVLWDYNQKATFCAIYGRRPGDYLNDEGMQSDIPKYPPDSCLSYEDALGVAKNFLCSYDRRITEDYLSQLHIGSYYYDFWGDAATTITHTSHVQVWIIQFVEGLNPDDYWVRFDAYIDANTGRVVCVDIGLDMLDKNDTEHHKTVQFK